MRTHRSTGFALALVALFVWSPNLQAQDADIPVELDETATYGVGARAVAMGLAQQAITFDPLALTGNPAALAFLPDHHLNGSFSIRSITASLERGSFEENSLSRVALDHVIFAFPLSREAGLAVGSYVINDPSRELAYVGRIADGHYEVDAVDVEASLRAWSVGGGWAVTPRFSLGGRIEILDGTREEIYTVAHGLPGETFDTDEFGLCYSCGGSDTAFREDVISDLNATGYRGALSAFGFVGENIRLGATLEFPTQLEYTGSVLIRYEDFLGPFADERLSILDEITLPLSFSFGGAWENEAFTFAADGRYTDWEQIDFEGDILGPDPDGGPLRRSIPAYRSTFDVHLGGEYRLKSQPVALRAGVQFTPLPYRFIAGDTELVFDANDPEDPGDDTSYYVRDYPLAEITTDRTAVSGGLGIQVNPEFMLDFAYQYTNWERMSRDGSTAETRSSSRILMNLGYRW